MAIFNSRVTMIHTFLMFSLYFSDFGFLRVNSLGINYGRVGDNLLPPEKVINLLKYLNLTKTRIYDTNPQVLAAFANSNIELVVTVENELLPQLINPVQALHWVTAHIKPYFPAVRITGIAVGNEMFTTEDNTLLVYLVPAMASIHGALLRLGLDTYIQVSTPNSLEVLEESYPPSAGSFKNNINSTIKDLLQFLWDTKAPFWINAYPFFVYKEDPKTISLDYVLFRPTTIFTDQNTKLQYDNMLYAQVDAVIFAIARMGFPNIEVQVSETGWPSKGNPDEIGATLENALTYNGNLVRRQLKNEGTPLRPNMRLEVYLFALFNEDLKPGPTSERNYGLCLPDGTVCYNVGLPAPSSNSTPSTDHKPPGHTSPAIKDQAANMDCQSLVYWMFFHLLIFQVFMRRPY
ncbi:glucan endo-1,3-beta-glucosidase 14-like [Alnus glutinosa]|uniref:glucan endo-1,3-beta-glucosidase 14-like n=1 Tax=Alnus glutinosa TaxID=3517 RepID=UPI002D793F24|nr:glucan endo-1,3-beta-glucosidase 14-like [Alnus glutinosa]